MISSFVSPLLALFLVGFLLSISLAILVGLVLDLLFKHGVRSGKDKFSDMMQIAPHSFPPPAE